MRGVLLHSSGKFIISCSDDKSIRVFDIKVCISRIMFMRVKLLFYLLLSFMLAIDRMVDVSEQLAMHMPTSFHRLRPIETTVRW